MPRASSHTAVAVILAVCASASSCEPTRSPPGAAAGLPPVEEPGIGWTPRVYHVPRAESPPEIDGSPDEETWRNAPWTADFVDIRGPSMPAPRHRTRAKMLWDDEFLYICAVLAEPHVWGTLTERDAVIYHDNDFEVFIDPDADTHMYYELEINALGTVWDLLLARPYRDGGPAIDAWDIRGLRTAVAVDGTLGDPSDIDGGWSLEIAIPWSVLAEAAGRPAPPAPGDRWRVNFSRVQWRHEVRRGRYEKLTDPETGESAEEDNWVWSPQGLIAMHYPEMWGIAEFTGREGAVGGVSSTTLTEGERALWALRGIYYRERRIAADEGSWTAEVGKLGLGEAPDPGVAWPPTIWLTPSGFEAVLPLSDGREAHIREDGLTWISD